MSKTVTCPNCGKPVPWGPDSRWRPFCSQRCRLIDLGEWIDGRYRVSEPTDEGYAPQEQDEGRERH
jgi:endogenous inhibitor of DNA gyrase (YacG/DUF329 family)